MLILQGIPVPSLGGVKQG